MPVRDAGQLGGGGQRQFGGQLTGKGVEHLGEMFDRGVIVAGDQLGDGPIPDQAPSPADPFGQVVELAGRLCDVTEIQERADFHQRQLDRLGQVDALRVQGAVPGRTQRGGDVGRIDQRHRQRGDDLPGGQLLRMHLAVQVHVGVGDQ